MDDDLHRVTLRACSAALSIAEHPEVEGNPGWESEARRAVEILAALLVSISGYKTGGSDG